MPAPAERVAVYCTADAGYVVPSLIALASMRRFHPEHDYFIIADRDRLSPGQEQIISKQGIELIHFGKNQLFADVAHLTKECYWKFVGPEIFLPRSFRFSMLIDGDTLCVRPFEFTELLPLIEGYAGIRRYESARHWSFRYPEWIQRQFRLAPEIMESDYTNTGVVIWNNQKMVELGLLERAVTCYGVCCRVHPGMFRVGDQSLMALISEIQPRLPWFILPATDNFRVNSEEERRRLSDPESIRIIHYTGRKPWVVDSLSDCIRNAGKPAFMHRLAFKARWESFVMRSTPFWPDLSLKSPNPLHRALQWTNYKLLDIAKRIIFSSLSVSLIRRVRLLLGRPPKFYDTGWSRTGVPRRTSEIAPVKRVRARNMPVALVTDPRGETEPG